MSRPNPLWLALIGILVVLCFALPYTVFRDVDAWYGSLLFWIIATGAVILISAFVSSRWRD